MKVNKNHSRLFKLISIVTITSSSILLPSFLVTKSKDNFIDYKQENSSSSSGTSSGGSGTGENSSGSNSNGSNNGNYETFNTRAKREKDPTFSTFKEKLKEQLKKGIEEVKNEINSFLDEELKKIGDLKTPETDKNKYFEKIERKTYLTELKKYFSKENNWTEKPDELGFNITFPYVIANLEKLYTATVKFEGKDYSDVKVGLSTDKVNDINNKEKKLDYSDVINGNNKIAHDNKPQDNFINSKEFDDAVNNYLKTWKTDVKKMIYQNQDILEFGKDIFLTPSNGNSSTSSSENSTQVDGYTVFLNNNKHKSWNEYIKDKISKRFTHFDLEQNQKFKIVDEAKPTPTPTKPTLPDPTNKPLVPTNPPSSQITQAVEALPNLEPYINYQFASYDLSNLKSTLSSASEEEKEKYFFFLNPINTRFKYTVDQIHDNNSVVVRITDQAKSGNSRTYIYENVQVGKDWRFLMLLEKESKYIEQEFNKLYKALLLDEKINYNSLAHDSLQESVFSLVNAATQIVSSSSFKSLWFENIINNYQKIDESDQFGDYTNWANKKAKYLFETLLKAISASKLNNNPGWYVLVKAFNNVKYDLDQLTNDESTYNSHLKRAQEFDLDLKYYDQLYDALEHSILKLSTTANQLTKNLHISSWFNKYTDDIKDAREYVEILRNLLTGKPISKDSEDYKEFMTNYQKAIDKLNEKNQTTNKTAIIIGSILLSLGLLFIITNLLILFIKAKKKNKNSKLIFIVTSCISTISSVMGIILLILGMKG
ncbi:MSC_0620 family F1-like ATPase-associated subunit [Mycoplasma capricolum]|uniref:MSC_0620 family F1-like ATPase-associated subunit n=1 Tax=Mycoplasma capricolum TaxID=2095 RepID=UPI003DA5D51B